MNRSVPNARKATNPCLPFNLDRSQASTWRGRWAITTCCAAPYIEASITSLSYVSARLVLIAGESGPDNERASASRLTLAPDNLRHFRHGVWVRRKFADKFIRLGRLPRAS